MAGSRNLLCCFAPTRYATAGAWLAYGVQGSSPSPTATRPRTTTATFTLTPTRTPTPTLGPTPSLPAGQVWRFYYRAASPRRSQRGYLGAQRVAMHVQGDAVPGNNGVFYLVYRCIRSIQRTDCLTSCWADPRRKHGLPGIACRRADL